MIRVWIATNGAVSLLKNQMSQTKYWKRRWRLLIEKSRKPIAKEVRCLFLTKRMVRICRAGRSCIKLLMRHWYLETNFSMKCLENMSHQINLIEWKEMGLYHSLIFPVVIFEGFIFAYSSSWDRRCCRCIGICLKCGNWCNIFINWLNERLVVRTFHYFWDKYRKK